MPQIAQLAETYSSQIFWLLVTFGFVFFVVGLGMVPRILGTVEQRDSQIAGDLAAAKAARDGADSQEEAWRERENANRIAAQALIAKAKTDAAEKSEKTMSAAQKRLDTKIEKAEAEIGKAHDTALKDLENVAAEAAQEMVSRLSGASVPAAKAKAAVKEAFANG